MKTPFEPLSFADDRRVAALRRLVWLYFWLLIFEGALRKWLPSLSEPLLIVRDPVALLIYVQALRCRRFPFSGPMLTYFFLMVSFLLIALFQIVGGIGGGPFVAVYGLRTNFLHLPLILVIPQAFSFNDVLKLGRWILILSIPMAALMVLQYSSPAGSWINAGTSADADQLAFAMGKIRAAGTFSYVTGAAHFFVLATAFAVYAVVERYSGYSRWLLWPALLSILIVQPVSGSRTLVLGCGLILAGALAFAIFSPAQAPRIVAALLFCCAAFALLSLTSFFHEAKDLFMLRWNDANTAWGGAERGLIGRFVGVFEEPFALLSQAGPIGKGIGLGTNAGAALVTGSPVFLLAENEWARVVLEAGPLAGFSYLAYRVWLAILVGVRAAWGARQGQLLPWLLAWSACLGLLTEQLSQPTDLGFMVLVSGLCLAAVSDPLNVAHRTKERRIEAVVHACAFD
jgi:hypothetical protein